MTIQELKARIKDPTGSFEQCGECGSKCVDREVLQLIERYEKVCLALAHCELFYEDRMKTRDEVLALYGPEVPLK